MHRTHQTSSILFLSIVLGCWFLPATLHAQAQAKLPGNWQQMSPTDFATAIRALFEKDAFELLSIGEEQAAKAQGKQFFLQVDLSNTELSYQTIEILHWLTRFDLAADVIDRTKAALLARQDDWTGVPYAEAKAKVMLMVRLKFDDGTKIAEARRWVLAGGTKDQIPQADLQYDIVRQCFGDMQLIPGSFAAEWNGLITAPQTGSYVFSISPINVNSTNPSLPIKFAMTVAVGGQVVLNSTPNAVTEGTVPPSWVVSSSAVSLTAGRPVAIKVNASADVPTVPDGMLHAILSWQGPGISPSVVPPARFTQTDGKPGIQVTYTWKANGQPQTLTRVDDNIDTAWTKSPILLSQDTATTAQASDDMWTALTSSAFLDSYLGPPVRMHPFIKESDNTSAGLTTARRAAFLALLQQKPELLDAVNTKFAVSFYQSFRMGTPETALDVFGLWANRQADLVCATVQGGPEFDADTRAAAGFMAMLTTQQLPGHAVRLQNEFLQLPDGRCSLPVAYTLAASYLAQKNLDTWTAFLDGKLGDGTLAGDVRVNWLIARAEAEEIRFLPQGFDVNPDSYKTPRALDGMRYLNQAFQAAQNPAVKARVAREIAGRLVWGGQAQAAQDFLQKTLSALPADQQADLAALKSQIASQAAAQASSSDNQAAAAKQAYITTLKNRRDQAAARGDQVAVDRYNALIGSAGQ